MLVFFDLKGFVFLFEFDGDAFVYTKVFVASLLLGFRGFFFIAEIGFFDVFTGEVGYTIQELAFFIYQCECADAIFAGCFKIVSSKAWCDVNDTGTIFCRYEVADDYSEGIAFFGLCIGKELDVAGTFKVGAFLGIEFSPGEDFLLGGIVFQGFFSAFGAEILSYQGRRQCDLDFNSRVRIESLYLVVVDVVPHRQRCIARQCPRRGCPCEEILVLCPMHLKLRHDRGVLHVLVGTRLIQFMT